MSTVEYPSSFYSKISIPSYSYQGTATGVPPVVSTVPANPPKLIKQLTTQLFNHTITPGDTLFLFDDQEVGQLRGFEIAVDNPDTILQIIVYADNPTVPNFINNLQMHELLSLGRGLTPGDVAVLPNGQTQDIPGRPSNIYPYLARFKYDTIPDFTSQFTTNIVFGQLPNVIVLKYEPSVMDNYKRIIGNVINTDTVNSATVINLDVKRLIIDQLLPGENPPIEATTRAIPVVKRTVAVKSSLPDYSYTSPTGASSPEEEIPYES